MATDNKSLWYRGVEYRRVSCQDHRSRNRQMQIWVTRTGQFLVVRSQPMQRDAKGYWYCRFKGRLLYVSRAVLMAWVRPPRLKEVAMHLDDDHENNSLSNLKWGTQRQNAEMMVLHGRSCRGEKQGGAKLTEADVLEIRRAVRRGVTCRELAHLKKVSVGCVWNAATGKAWGWLPGVVRKVKAFQYHSA